MWSNTVLFSLIFNNKIASFAKQGGHDKYSDKTVDGILKLS